MLLFSTNDSIFGRAASVEGEAVSRGISRQNNTIFVALLLHSSSDSSVGNHYDGDGDDDDVVCWLVEWEEVC